jgi:hypothetical protein
MQHRKYLVLIEIGSKRHPVGIRARLNADRAEVSLALRERGGRLVAFVRMGGLGDLSGQRCLKVLRQIARSLFGDLVGKFGRIGNLVPVN